MADALDDTSVDVTPTRNLRSRTAPVSTQLKNSVPKVGKGIGKGGESSKCADAMEANNIVVEERIKVPQYTCATQCAEEGSDKDSYTSSNVDSSLDPLDFCECILEDENGDQEGTAGSLVLKDSAGKIEDLPVKMLPEKSEKKNPKKKILYSIKPRGRPRRSVKSGDDKLTSLFAYYKAIRRGRRRVNSLPGDARVHGLILSAIHQLMALDLQRGPHDLERAGVAQHDMEAVKLMLSLPLTSLASKIRFPANKASLAGFRGLMMTLENSDEMEEEGREDIFLQERGQSQQLIRSSDEKLLSALVTTFGCCKPFLLDFETPVGGPMARTNCPSLETTGHQSLPPAQGEETDGPARDGDNRTAESDYSKPSETEYVNYEDDDNYDNDIQFASDGSGRLAN